METQQSIIKSNPNLLAALASGGISIQVLPKEILVLQTIVAGTSFTNANTFENKLYKNVALQMKREPKNKYDAFAIVLLLNNKKVGYLPKDKNEVIARLLDAGKSFVTKITEKEMEGSWMKIEVDVFLKD